MREVLGGGRRSCVCRFLLYFTPSGVILLAFSIALSGVTNDLQLLAVGLSYHSYSYAQNPFSCHKFGLCFLSPVL